MNETKAAVSGGSRVAVFLEGFSRKAKEGLQVEAKGMPTSLARYLIGVLAGMTAEERKLAYGEGQAAISRFCASGMDRDAAQEAAMGFAIDGEEIVAGEGPADGGDQAEEEVGAEADQVEASA